MSDTTRRRYLLHTQPAAMPTTACAVRDFSAVHDAAGMPLMDPRRQRQVAELSANELAWLQQRQPGLHLEEDHPLDLLRMPGLPPTVDAKADVRELLMQVSGPGSEPVPDCSVYGVAQGVAYRGCTDADGRVTLAVGEAPLERLIVSPRHSYWSRTLAQPEQTLAEPGRLDCSLQALVPGRDLAWVHLLLGSYETWQRTEQAGAGVRVAVIDSGVDVGGGAIRVAGGLNTLDGQDPTAWHVDEKGHGTHCSGVIAGSLNTPSGLFSGLAPQAELYVVKVFPGGFISDLLEAIDWCIAQRMDVVNLSLGSQRPSASLADALARAHAAGVAVIAAAGNDATHLAYPASNKPVMSVGAIGRLGSFPQGSAHDLKIGRYRDTSSQLFSASFSNFGDDLDLVAPGVAITSTVPGGFAAWDGTSMACPIVTGLAALVLGAHPWLRTGDGRQVDALRYALQCSCRPLALPGSVQGLGVPHAWRACLAASGLLGTGSEFGI